MNHSLWYTGNAIKCIDCYCSWVRCGFTCLSSMTRVGFMISRILLLPNIWTKHTVAFNVQKVYMNGICLQRSSPPDKRKSSIRQGNKGHKMTIIIISCFIRFPCFGCLSFQQAITLSAPSGALPRYSRELDPNLSATNPTKQKNLKPFLSGLAVFQMGRVLPFPSRVIIFKSLFYFWNSRFLSSWIFCSTKCSKLWHLNSEAHMWLLVTKLGVFGNLRAFKGVLGPIRHCWPPSDFFGKNWKF